MSKSRSEKGASTRRAKPRRSTVKRALKITLPLGLLVFAAIAFGSFVSNRAKENIANVARQETVLPDPTPQYGAASPAIEYIYAGGKLVAASQANQPAQADIAIFRPSSGAWWVTTAASHVVYTFGQSGDIPVPADYDGDGKADCAVFRPSTGGWHVLRSSDNTTASTSWGQSTDIVVPADYEGDGKADIAVWRGSNSTWYIIQSSDQNPQYVYYGASTDIPNPADYDGDGRADPGLWRNSNTTFYSLNSTAGAAQITFSVSSTQPVSADYDGDGKADYAVRNGTDWVIRKSSNATTDTISWQQSGDIAIPKDYDGDGKTDIAVWRDSNGNWYIRQSSQVGQSGELRQVGWGTSGDVPVGAIWRR